jgi:hypothetical protein
MRRLFRLDTDVGLQQNARYLDRTGCYARPGLAFGAGEDVPPRALLMARSQGNDDPFPADCAW